jgi:hypothetical protein
LSDTSSQNSGDEEEYEYWEAFLKDERFRLDFN